MKVELLDCMGDDLTVVNAARVSYAKEHADFQESDVKLLRYLADHGHWTPFAHPQVSFRISASIAVARQLFRHQVGLTVNETSRRYVSDEPTFDIPATYRPAPAQGQSKQGSGEPFDDMRNNVLEDEVLTLCIQARETYERMLSLGCCPEQARLVLPMATVTEWIWTGSLYAFIRIIKERTADDAQAETRAVSEEIQGHLSGLFPHSMKAWGVA